MRDCFSKQKNELELLLVLLCPLHFSYSLLTVSRCAAFSGWWSFLHLCTSLSTALLIPDLLASFSSHLHCQLPKRQTHFYVKMHQKDSNGEKYNPSHSFKLRTLKQKTYSTCIQQSSKTKTHIAKSSILFTLGNYNSLTILYCSGREKKYVDLWKRSQWILKKKTQ